MLLIKMSHLQFAILFLCLTSVLTFSIDESVHSSGNSSDPAESVHQADSLKNSTSVVTDNFPILVASPPTKEISANHTFNKSILAEGGPVPALKSSTFEETALTGSANVSPQNLTYVPREDASDERNAKSSVVPRKGVAPKIVPRKGAERISDTLDDGMEEPEPDKNLNPQVAEDTRNSLVSKDYKFPSNVSDSTSMRMFNGVEKTVQAESVMPRVNWTNLSSTTEAPKKHKPKPTATVGGLDEDKPIPASPTKTSPLGMPRKIDYIVPVVITIMAIPLLGLAAFVVYRRGRDCWDKRHYRRMDFLIDGMYNDWSSKGHTFPDSE